MKEDKNIGETNWERIAGFVFDSEKELSREDIAQIEGLSEEEKKELTNSKKLAKKLDVYLQQNKYSKTDAWEKIQKSMHQNKLRKLSFGKFLKIAAIVVFAIVTAGLGIQYLSSDKFMKNTIVARQEMIDAYKLPDGSVVSVNAGSKLFYPSKFTGETREVIIEGEAFFDIKPDASKPFIIKAGDAEICVLGTSFNVDAYPGADKVEVVVKTGKVKFSYQKNKSDRVEEVTLDPGDKGVLTYSKKSLVKTSNIDENFLSWKTRILIFRHTSLSEVVDKIEKVYGVEIDLSDEKLNKLHLNAEYRNYSIEDVMKLVSSTLDIEVEKIDNGRYLFKEPS